jgi:hypothetical protein
MMSNQLSYRRRPDLATFYGGALDEAQARDTDRAAAGCCA